MRSYLLGLFACVLAGSVSAQDIQTIERPMIIVELRGEAPGHAPEIVIALDGVELLRTTVSPQWQEIVARMPDGYESSRSVSVQHVMPPCSVSSLNCNSIQAEVFMREASFAGESLRPANETIARSGDLLHPGDTRYFLRGMQFNRTDRTADGIAYVEGLLREPEPAEPCEGGSAECTSDAEVDSALVDGPDIDCPSPALEGELDEAEFRRLNALLAVRMSTIEEAREADDAFENLKYDLIWDYAFHEELLGPGFEDEVAGTLPHGLAEYFDTASIAQLRISLAHQRRLAALPPSEFEGGSAEIARINTAIEWHTRLIAALERKQLADERLSDLRAAMSCD